MRWYLIIAGALAAAPLAGQATATFRFRYDPAPGRLVHSLTEIRTLTTVNGLPTIPDGTAIESEARIFAFENVAGEASGGRRVVVGIDSVHLRTRQPEQAWVELPAPPFAGRRTRATVDERLHVTAIETSSPEDGIVLRVLTGWAATLGFALPDTAVTVGGTFRPDAQVPFEVALTDAGGLPLREVLLGELAMTLDSLVPRPGDTLAYLHFAGRFAPRSVESTGESGTRADRFAGGFAGSLLWSTGWDAFVSGGLRVRVTGVLHQETPAGVVDATIDWDATLVHRIRP